MGTVTWRTDPLLPRSCAIGESAAQPNQFGQFQRSILGERRGGLCGCVLYGRDMAFMRRAAKIDTAQPDIVAGLERWGYSVVKLGFPVDLAVRKDSWSPGMFQLMEVKTASSTGRIPVKKRQSAQRAFLADFNVPVVTTLDGALSVLADL